jgi:hypothetical protein
MQEILVTLLLLQLLKSINLSLSCLKDCIRLKKSLKNNTSITSHIPYRRSKLTLILRDYLFEKQKQYTHALQPTIQES